MFYDDRVVDIRNNVNTTHTRQTVDINSLFFEKILSFIKPEVSILDIGTGNGFVLSSIAKLSNVQCYLYGVDNSTSMVEAAKKTVADNINIVVGDNYNLPFENETFDIITAKNVTRFEPKEIYRLLKKGGVFVFREYNEGKGMVEIANLFNTRLIRSRDSGYYVNILQSSGMRVIFLDDFLIKRVYESVADVITTVSSYPFIDSFTKEDEKTIEEYFKGKEKISISSDPFILVAKK